MCREIPSLLYQAEYTHTANRRAPLPDASMSVFIKGNNYEFLDLDLTSQAGISSQAPRQELHKILSKYGKIVRLKTGYQDFAFVVNKIIFCTILLLY
jgi:hypothetical protein